MPLYEYQCTKCGRFEIIRKFSDAPLSACPTCGRKVQRLPSAPAIQFKGTGWYVTDYARKSAGGQGESKGESKGSGTASSSKETAKDAGSSEKSTSKDASASGSGTSGSGTSSK